MIDFLRTLGNPDVPFLKYAVIAGIGLSLYLQGQHNIEWFTPIFGAMIAAVFSAFIIGFVSIYGKQREDTIIGSVWAVGMALGVLFIFLYRQFLAVSFDEEFTRARGINTTLYTMLLLLLTALSIVLLVTIVGIIMVIALLTIPAAMASLFSRSLWKIMVFAVLFTMIFTFFGTGISYVLDTPSGSTIILFAGGLYVLAVTVKKLFRHREKKREKPHAE